MSEAIVLNSPPSVPVASDRTRLLLEGPVLWTLIRLAAPTVALMTFQAVVHSAEGYFVGFLGSEALAGVSLSFPLVMLMTTMSAGAYGGGVSSAIARALGAGRSADAEQICGTALTLATVLGALTTLMMWCFGRTIFSLLGATSGALDAAVAYSNIFFLGAIPFWQFQAAASCLRGSGNTNFPAAVGAIGGALTLAISPPFIFGIGSWPGLGLAGAAWAVVIYNVLSAGVLIIALRAQSLPFQLRWINLLVDRRFAATILRVAIPSAANTLQSNLTFLALTALVAQFGTSAIAGYGMGGRLEYLLIPIIFGTGSALIPLVGANLTAGQVERARQATRTAVVLGALIGAAIGCLAASQPLVWMGIFTDDSRVLNAGRSYLQIVGPCYFAFGGGLMMFFAAQGRGQVLPSLLAGFVRLLVAAAGGYVLTGPLGLGIDALFACMAGALLGYGGVMWLITRKHL